MQGDGGDVAEAEGDQEEVIPSRRATRTTALPTDTQPTARAVLSPETGGLQRLFSPKAGKGQPMNIATAPILKPTDEFLIRNPAGEEIGSVRDYGEKHNGTRFHAVLRMRFAGPVSGNQSNLAQGHGDTKEGAVENAITTGLNDSLIYADALRRLAADIGVAVA